MNSMKAVIEKIGRTPLTVEERAHVSEHWNEFDTLTKMEIAARFRGLRNSKMSISDQYMDVMAIVIDMNRRYAKSK